MAVVGWQAVQHEGWGLGEQRGVKCNKERKKSIVEHRLYTSRRLFIISENCFL